MINHDSFTEEYIRKFQQKSNRDPGLIERVIYAFGLLEAVARAGLPFIFKGGTSLMLLTDTPRRFSTDIDIIVDPDTLLDGYLQKAAEYWPFSRFEEQERRKISGIEKRHFKFIYDSPIKKSEFFILLDVVFEKSHYATLIEKDIVNSLLITEEPYIKIMMPNSNGLLGDKLTAFAPNTTGILYDNNKELEIIKQLYDIATLVPIIDNFIEVKNTYFSIVQSELLYRNLKLSIRDVLNDTISTALCVAGKGYVKSREYDLLSQGIRNIRNHMIAESFNSDTAMKCACAVLYIAVHILVEKDDLPQIIAIEKYKSLTISDPRFISLKYIKKIDLQAYAYLYEALTLLP